MSEIIAPAAHISDTGIVPLTSSQLRFLSKP